jgi:hypothetical protein
VYDTETAKVWTLPAPDDAADLIGITAVWADDALVVFGGVAYGSESSDGVTNHAWLYTP